MCPPASHPFLRVSPHQLLDGSHGSEEEGGRLPEDESVFSCGACAKVCPCFSCCCASCLRKEQRGRDRAAGLVTQDEVEAAARRRKVGEYFLHHFLAVSHRVLTPSPSLDLPLATLKETLLTRRIPHAGARRT